MSNKFDAQQFSSKLKALGMPSEYADAEALAIAEDLKATSVALAPDCSCEKLRRKLFYWGVALALFELVLISLVLLRLH
jgi:hypothetical protein